MFGIASIFMKFPTWDSILTNCLNQTCSFLQALVRLFCGQFFYAFNMFDSSLNSLLKLFGANGSSLRNANWADFTGGGTVINAFAVFALIGVFVAVLVLIISLFKIALAPIIEAKEKPLTVIVRFVIAMILIFYSPGIIMMISDASGTLTKQISSLSAEYGAGADNEFKSDSDNNELFKNVTHYDEIEDIVKASIGDESAEAVEGAPSLNDIQRTGAAIVEIVCNIVLMVEFLKLLTEICMREMVLLMLYMFFPSMAGTIVSRDTETIFRRYLQSLFVQILLTSTSVLWYWMFMNLCTTMNFKTYGIVLGMLFEIGFVQMEKSVDNHLAQLGVSSAAVSGNLFDSIMGTMHSVTCTASQLGKAIHGMAVGAEKAARVIGNQASGIGQTTGIKGDPSVLTKAVRNGEKVSVPADKLRNAAPGSFGADGRTWETVRQAMSNPSVFNAGMDHDQRDACVSSMFGQENLDAMAKESGIKSMPESWTMNPDGSLTGHNAVFDSGNTGDITLSSSNKVAPGAVMDEKFDMANGRTGEQFTMGAGGTIRPSDVSLAAAPQTDGEAIALTGHSMEDLKENPGMAAGFMNSAESYMQNSVLGDRSDTGSIRADMDRGGISLKDGSMNAGRDGLVHGKANIGTSGEQGVVMGSAGELRNAGYSNIATFKNADGSSISMALARDAQRGSINNSTENMTDAQAQMMTGETAKRFKDNAINHADLYSNDMVRGSDVSDSLENGISGEAFRQSGIDISVNSKGEMKGHVPHGASYNFVREGQLDLGSEEGREQAEDFVHMNPEHNFVDAAGNKFTASPQLDGEAHGSAGDSFDFPIPPKEKEDGSGTIWSGYGGNGIDHDTFKYNVGSPVEDIVQGFGGYPNTNIASMTLESNGAQTAYNEKNEIQGVRMANKATSSKGSPDYQYDLKSADGITDSAQAAVMFGEPATTMDDGISWETQSGTRYERMSSANTLFYGKDNSRTKMVSGHDLTGRPYTYVSMEKPKGFTSNSRPDTGEGRDSRRRHRTKRQYS